MNPYDLPACIAQTWFKRLSIRAVDQIPAGFSGAAVFRCTDSRGDRYALKRWPIGTSPDRVREVHSVVTQARQFGCELLPHLVPASATSTVVLHDNECWEMSIWVDGETIPFNASPSLVAEGASAIASFHRATVAINLAGFSNEARSHGSTRRVPSPAIVARLRRVEQLHVEVPQALAAALPMGLSPPLSGAVEKARELLRERWSFTAPELCRELNSRLAYTVDTLYVLRDVHRDHILFAANGLFASNGIADGSGPLRPRAIIDFDAIRFDCPSVDLARWVGSFYDISCSQHRLLDTAVAGYRQDWRLSEDQIVLARTLLRVSPWVNLGNWVVWIVLGTRKFENDELAIAGRISELVDQITDGF